jgi:dihydrofolate synthase/folylpolyglutamate synthase
MNFQTALNNLEKLVSFERDLSKVKVEDFGIQNLKNVLVKMGASYHQLPVIHVAGSKGKGTTCNLLSGFLQKLGFNVGLYTSPHFLDVRERILFNGEMISEQAFADLCEQCFEHKNLTYFDFLTLISVLWFNFQKPDFAVYEVGLGGRLDSTNIFSPKLTILTRTELEHANILGSTIEEVLKEQLGIMKSGVTLVVAPQREEVYTLLRKILGDDSRVVYAETCDLDDIDQCNYLTVKAGLQALKLQFLEDDLRQFCEKFSFIGRFDLRVVSERDVLFDMAHTVDSFKGLFSKIKAKFSGRKLRLLISIMNDKQIKEMLEVVAANKDLIAEIIFCESHLKRSEKADILKNEFQSLGAEVVTKVNEDANKAFTNLLDNTKKNEMVVVTGSHFLVANLLSAL